ncbi:MAG TPA: Crp/Fnr family transcriptional regulator [Fimbriimonadaceae bacterium]|nr:Crp/Fnr family transcriptional regulator [Fimbriimonadaceae bacterium]
MAKAPERPTKLGVIQSCTVMNALSESERSRVAEESTMAYAARGEPIWLAGAPAVFFSVVGVGFVKMSRTTPQGAEVAVELLVPGQCFGLLAALQGNTFPLSAIAVTDLWYLKVQAGLLHTIYNDNPGLRDQMLRAIAPRLHRAHEMMARMSTGKVEQRIAAVLLILMDSCGESAGSDVRLNVPLTRQDIAEMAGTTVETTIRAMSRWQKDGRISTDHQVITIHDAAALQRALLE